MARIDYNQYIIAIGASAGGIEAISGFFDHTPTDAVSYVLIQHLSADFKSQMAQILKPHSKLEIIEVTNHIHIAPNKVYLIPSTKFLRIKNGRLVLTDKKDKRPPHLTIDHFFLSLAEECGQRSIGVILSGTGRDGSKGIQAIKSSGGMVIVQDPETAAFNEMPLAAIQTGCADLVLKPGDMPRAIESYVRDTTEGMVLADDDLIKNPKLIGIFNLIKTSSTFDFTDYKRPTILRRIKRRLLQLNFSSIDTYYGFLQNNPDEVKLLANDFLISVTSFFRDPEAFKVLEEIVVPAIVAQKTSNGIIKIWVAGCATGEEAFSLAILMQEYLNSSGENRTIKIYATDIHKGALEIAKKGVYPESIADTVDKTRLKSFFLKTIAGYKINPEIRKMIVFAEHDLVRNVPYCNIDLISCRNVLIYMNMELQGKAFSMMHFGLRKHGYLMLGPSENTEALKNDFTEISTKWNVYQSNKAGRPVTFNDLSSPVMGNVTIAMETIKKTENPVLKITPNDTLDLAILQESGFNGVCTDENLMVVRSIGNTTGYLKNENFNFNLNDLIPDHISVVFKAAAHKALKLNQKIELKGLTFENAIRSDTRLVNLVIKPFMMAKPAGKFLLISFAENGNTKGAKVIEPAGFNELAKEHLINLEQELSASQLNLENANERLASSNENMQSFNEEQQSANEEMQSANEELQSVNEELHTINKEYQAANAQLMELNDDLNNYFRSNVNGQLFVDHNLLLKKYSPGAVKHINIRESDIGRPLSNITTNIKFETLIDDIKQVMLNEETITREAEASNGKIYQVMTMPYIRKHSKKSDGAVISFYDITELKKVSLELDDTNKKLHRTNEEITTVNTQLNDRNEQLNNSKKYIEEIFNTIHDPLVILDKELRVIRATDGFYQTFKATEEETEGSFLYNLGNKQWDIPALRRQLENVLPEQGFFTAFEVNHVFDVIGHKIMRLTARQFDTYTHETLTLLAIHDLTDKRKVEEGLAEVERLLAESKERLHFAIESAGIGSWDFNVYTKELIWDNRCKELSGLLPEDFVDYGVFLNQLHPADRKLTDEAVNKALMGFSNGEFNVEYRSVGLHDQKVRWIKSKGKAYFNEGKKATRFIGTVLDISTEKLLEQNTKELLLKKDEFISIASHELKTPVTSLKLSLQLLNRMKDNPSVIMFPRLIDQSNKSMEKITSLIDDLLNVTRMSEGQLTLNKASFTIAGLLNQCCTHVREQGKYEIVVQGDENLQVYADEDRIEQVLVNFVNNAVKYAPDSKIIYLSVEKEGEMAKVAVKDTGPGIPSDKLPYLFDRYYRSDYEGKQYSGLGLGLYICSEIIKRHGGEIGVDSELNQGSVFWFKIPL